MGFLQLQQRREPTLHTVNRHLIAVAARQSARLSSCGAQASCSAAVRLACVPALAGEFLSTVPMKISGVSLLMGDSQVGQGGRGNRRRDTSAGDRGGAGIRSPAAQISHACGTISNLGLPGRWASVWHSSPPPHPRLVSSDRRFSQPV